MKSVVGILDRHVHVHEQNLVVGSIEKVLVGVILQEWFAVSI